MTPGEYAYWCGAALKAQEELRNGAPPAPPTGNGKPIIEGECSEVPDPLLLEGPNPWLS